MKNILAENLLRFGVKNLNESDKKVLSEALLLEQIQQVATALDELNTAMAAKPTGLGTHQIYPSISLEYGAKLERGSNKTLTLTPAMIPQGLMTNGVNTFMNASEPLGGKSLPIKLSVYKSLKQGSGGMQDNYGKFITTLPNGPKIKLWGGIRGTMTTNAPYKSEIKSAIETYCNNYYTSGTEGRFWGVKNVNAKITGSTSDFITQLDKLLDALGAIWIQNKPEGRAGDSGGYKLVCINQG